MDQAQCAASSEERQQTPWTSRIMGAILMTWIVVVSIGVQSYVWLSEQPSYTGSIEQLDYTRAVGTAVQSLLLLAPLAPLAIWWKHVAYRRIFRIWTLSAIFTLWLTPVHLPGPIEAYAATLLQIVLALAFCAVLVLWTRRTRAPAQAAARPSSRRGLALALILAPLLLAPWLQQGALGAPLEALLNVVASLSLGLAAALLLDRLWPILLASSAASRAMPLRNRVLGGFVVGTSLLIMSTGFGFGGIQLLLALHLPATAWALTAIVDETNEWPWVGFLIGLVALGPLLLIDPREMIGAGGFALFSTLGLAFRAAFTATLIAWAAGAFLLVLRWRAERFTPLGQSRSKTALLILLGIAAWTIAGAIYLGSGHPGFFGDRLFVVMRDQADVSAAHSLNDPAERRRYVYETLVAHADGTQGRLRRTLDRLGVSYTPYYLLNGLAVDGGPLVRAWLQAQPEVDRVLYNPRLRPAAPEGAGTGLASAPVGTPWNLEMIGADEVWADLGVTGAGIVIGQSDSGVQWDHREVRDSYRGANGDHDFNWLDPWYRTPEPVDTSGHGTHTLGIVLGNDTGVAPDAEWIGCANLARNLGNPANYLDCLQFTLAPFPANGHPFRDGNPVLGAHVLNNSWGCPALEGCDPASLQPAVDALRAAGTFVVVSAGNGGPNCGTINAPPALYDGAFSVGAVDRSRSVTAFSSRGPVAADGSGRTKPDVVAPGQEILSSFPGDTYQTLEGTSMAGPHVAGVVALMWSANPDLIGDVAATEGILADTARPDVDVQMACEEGNQVPNNLFGYGLVDAYAAVQEALAYRTTN